MTQNHRKDGESPTPTTSTWGPVLFLSAVLIASGAVALDQIKHKGRGSGSGVEYNLDGSIRSVTSERAEQALRQLKCFDALPPRALSAERRRCEELP